MTFNVNVVSLRQAIIPDQIQGRLNAATRTIAFGALSIGPLLGGVLGAWWGPAPTIFLGGWVFLAGALPILNPAVFRYRTPPQAKLPAPVSGQVPTAASLDVETCHDGGLPSGEGKISSYVGRCTREAMLPRNSGGA